jgi:hypothetical protein
MGKPSPDIPRSPAADAPRPAIYGPVSIRPDAGVGAGIVHSPETEATNPLLNRLARCSPYMRFASTSVSTVANTVVSQREHLYAWSHHPRICMTTGKIRGQHVSVSEIDFPLRIINDLERKAVL